MRLNLAPESCSRSAMDVWEEYRQEQQSNETRIQEHQDRIIQYNGKVLKYHVVIRGEKPDGGYPLYIALHGGGGEPVDLNNSAWKKMQTYYLESVIQGIYVAPRGITDTWDMHFRPESYVFYDRLIENMLLFESVDSDKVYLLGYSAGGDAVYQIAPRMADRFAAVNMSAGHHNWVDLRNLANLPIALQAGEHDELYNRHTETAKMNDKLDSLAAGRRDEYVHTTWIHSEKGHRFCDNDPEGSSMVVLESPRRWLAQAPGRSDTIEVNTNAIRWLDQFIRNPRPQRIVWDLRTRADRKAVSLWHHGGHGQQHSWIDISDHTAETLGVDMVIVEVEKKNNLLKVESCGNYLRLLVDAMMLDLQMPVTVVVEGKSYSVRVYPNRETQMETVRQRGDPRYIFDGSIVLTRTASGWNVIAG
jgi:predicted esterase